MVEGDDPISFIRRFRAFLSSHKNSNENIQKFFDGFKKAFSLRGELQKEAQKFMSGMIMREAQQSHKSQTSLIQCFFAVAGLKDLISKKLLNDLKDYVIEQ